MPGDFACICIELQKDWLYGLCMRLERNRHDADDLFQETCIKALERFDTYDTDRVIRPWLARICVNIYRDGLRRVKRHLAHRAPPAGEETAQDLLEAIPCRADAPDEQVIEEDFKRALATCLGRLEDKYRLPLLLQYVNGVSYDEISRILSLNPGTVKSRLNEAKKRLRKQMEAMGYERHA